MSVAGERVLVAFSGDTEISWLRWLLRPGFRHCFVLLNDGERWISLDPMAHYTELFCYDQLPSGFDIAGWLESRGITVLEAVIDKSRTRPAPPMFFTCVEAVKRVLGVHDVFILTPWQLYRFLKKKNHYSQESNQKSIDKKGEKLWAL